MDPQDTRAEALAFDKQRIVQVGSNKDMDSLIENGWPSLDLAGKTLLPGFIDTHQHTMLTGLMATAVPLNDVADMAEIVERLRNAVAQVEKGEWVRGSYLNEQNLVEKRMPSRTELDQASTQHPIYVLHATAHMCSFNSCALEILKIPRDLEGYDHEGGEPTGVVRDPGILTFVHPALSRVIPAETKVSALKKAARMASGQAGKSVATRSPLRIPRACSPAASFRKYAYA